jgi:hypothetical protein
VRLFDGCDDEEPLTMSDGIGLADVLLGLPGFRVLDVVETDVEVVVSMESLATRAFCRSCGGLAGPQDRMAVDVRDLACFGRPARLRRSKRRWRCRERRCAARTWTEICEHVDAQAVLTRRAGIEGCRQVGENAPPVSQLADELGVCWWTIMNAVVEHGTRTSTTLTASGWCVSSTSTRPAAAPR